jgi:hypothetical protein
MPALRPNGRAVNSQGREPLVHMPLPLESPDEAMVHHHRPVEAPHSYRTLTPGAHAPGYEPSPLCG